MAKARFELMDEDEENIIHQKSLECLGKIGVLINSQSVLKMLSDAGADVDEKSGITKIPEEMINEALNRAPKRIRLCARDSKYDMEVPVNGIPYVATTGLAVYITDIDSGEKRRASRKDLADLAKLADALPGVDYFWSVVVPMDVPEAAHTVHEVWTSLNNTVKHVQQVEVRDAEDARIQVKLGALVAGGEEELRKRPLFSVVCSPISPLSFSRGTIEAQVELAKAGIPVISMDMPLMGLSSPVTLAGTLTLINSENLASLVISQVASPGAPFVYSSDSVPANMSTGGVDFEAPEIPMIMTGLAQMAIRYGLPRMVGDWGLCGNQSPGFCGSFTQISSTSLDTFSGTDLCSGIGSIDDAKGASLEQVVIDAYVWENWKGFLRNVEISEESVALDVVREVGHGNTFLTHLHTAKNFKKELFFRDKKKMAWETSLSKGMVPEARAIAKRLLKEHEIQSLDPDILQKGDEILSTYEKKLAG